MDTTTIIALAVAALVVLGGVVLLGVARRTDTTKAIGAVSRETKRRDREGSVIRAEAKPSATGRELELAHTVERRQASKALATTGSSEPVAWTPPDPVALGATRRQFLNRAITGWFVVGISGFAAASLAFLWPQLSGGFGAPIRVGRLADIKESIRSGGGFFYFPEGQAWITEYPASGLERARATYDDRLLTGMEVGVVALWQKCPHLGCRVPECATSQWFECPCHGSQYNRVGEKRGGPAPRGMDRFAMEVSDDVLTIDTGDIIEGPPIGTNTTGQEAEGPHCVGAGASDH